MGSEVRSIKCAVVGLGFGAEFVPIYLKHPNISECVICDLDSTRRNRVAEVFGLERSYASFDDVLADPEIDAVHLNSGLFAHASMTIAALRAGKHVMCTVPMATTLEECRAVVAAVAETGLKYMMAETVVYSREFLYVKELYESGRLGSIQYMQASHTQDMSGWPEYWQRMSPMLYATHIVSPILALVNGQAEYVSCFGSGAVNPVVAEKSGNRFAVESSNFKIKDMDLSAHIWRFLFDTARQYRESFDVFGTNGSFEWALIDGEPHVFHEAQASEGKRAQRIEIPDYAHLLPEEIREFTTTIHDPRHRSFIQGGGHGGSHPHLVHAFVSSIVDDTEPWPNAVTAANWTSVGICSHQSAQQSGTIVHLPDYTL